MTTSCPIVNVCSGPEPFDERGFLTSGPAREASVGALSLPVGRHRVAVPAGDGAEPFGAVAREVEYDAVTDGVGADAEPGHLVAADDVDHRHRGLHDDPGRQRSLVVG